MPKSTKILYAIATGLLLSIGWPSIGSITPLLFIALVPLLLLDQKIAQEKLNGKNVKFFPYVYLAIFTFNTITTWWVWNASPFGVVMAILLNSLFLSIAIWLAHIVRLKLGNFRGNLAWVFLWIGWEYIHLDWDLSWTWLTLGNGFAQTPSLVQWYEYTGVFGGSLWIILSNLAFTKWISVSQKMEQAIWKYPSLAYAIRWVLIILIPIGISLRILSNYEETIAPSNIVVVQPNIDPYNEKFNGLSPQDQLAKMLDLARQKTTSQTEFVVFPETAIPQPFDEAQWDNSVAKHQILDFLNDFPNAKVVIGASTFVVYPNKELSSPTARHSREGIWYDVCNTAVGLNANQNPEFYHKSKLVPGVEKMPFPSFFKNFQELAFDLGGTVGSQGSQKNREVFHSPQGTSIGPIICYESIYGEFVGDYVNEGAELLFIITNDGWWGDTPGYKQHLQYGQLRAIEHRRSIARSANTGTSCFIDQTGFSSQNTEWWEPAVISGILNKNSEITFYSENGDFIGRLCAAFGGLLVIFAISRGLMKKE